MYKCIGLFLEIAKLWGLCHFAFPPHMDLRSIPEKGIPLFGPLRYFAHWANSQRCSHRKKLHDAAYFFPLNACVKFVDLVSLRANEFSNVKKFH